MTRAPANPRGPVKGPLAHNRLASESLADLLDAHTTVGTLWAAEGERIRCVACGHRCLLAPGRRGVCKVRFNKAGQLRVPFGYVSGLANDPVEKKPFFHLLPGSDALTFGMLGCDFHCAYCQNWFTSQALRDPASGGRIQTVTPRQIASTALRCGAQLVVSSYNEPLITAEWGVAVFRAAREAGLLCAFVSNGNATPEALEFLRPWLVALKVDLKSFDDRRYRSLGGTLDRVMDTIRLAHKLGLWVEVVTLLVPGFNDSEEELRAIARFLAGVDPNIPWHVTAFHPDYRMTEPNATRASDLIRAVELGRSEGLAFVYPGNLPGRVGDWENTRCPGCGKTLIARHGFSVVECQVGVEGRCPHCARTIPGVFSRAGPAASGTVLSEPVNS